MRWVWGLTLVLVGVLAITTIWRGDPKLLGQIASSA